MTVIKVENLSKQYRLGNVGLGTIGSDLNRFYQTRLRGREDPYLKIGEENDRAQKGISEYVWALKDINFEVNQGEVLGIIGRNGAGKSTLLKILSRTTTPTTGQIKIKGRVASLLEVGTGFHGELTGRENIFLNGAILGMTKKEIKSKLDEIIDFSGVERYIDTPVKRYSSGMYVRLAFGVAAHLEPEILIVDEVLAVGDVEFQKKAIGKMKDVSMKDGRTVLFVSHNMAAVRKLCTRGLLLLNGRVNAVGGTEEIVETYTSNSLEKIERFNFKELIDKNKKIQFYNVVLLNKYNTEIKTAISGEPLKIKFEILNHTESVYKNCSIGIGISNLDDQLMIALKNDMYDMFYDLKPGLNEIMCEIPRLPLSGSEYKYNVILNNSSEVLDWVQEVGIFEVENGLFFPAAKVPAASRASVLVDHKWYG